MQSVRTKILWGQSGSRLLQSRRQLRFHVRPFRRNDAEKHAVANPVALGDHVAATYTFADCPQPGNRRLRALVTKIRHKLHAVHSQHLEGVSEQKQLALGVYPGGPDGGIVPGRADLDPSMPWFGV